MKIKKMWTLVNKNEYKSPEEEAAYHQFAENRAAARRKYNYVTGKEPWNSQKVDTADVAAALKECTDAYWAAAAAFKLATGEAPPYGPGRAKKPRIP